jgi:uncharacterized protein YjbI with pentapeptide repeats
MADENSKKPRLKPDDNPWYLLATLHLRRPLPRSRLAALLDLDFLTQAERDKLRKMNRKTWNRFMATKVGAECRARLIYPAELQEPLPEEELQAIKHDFAAAGMKIPDLRSDEIDFSNVDLDGFIFPGKCDFSGTIFAAKADFRGATFCGWADFVGATFCRNAIFNGAQFFDCADFQRATFDIASFANAKFAKADFRGATFSCSAHFIGATFSDKADFGGKKPSNVYLDPKFL